MCTVAIAMLTGEKKYQTIIFILSFFMTHLHCWMLLSEQINVSLYRAYNNIA